MKTPALQSSNVMNEFDLENLIQEVNEMIRFEKIIPQSKKIFTSAQLSRINNLKKRIVVRKESIKAAMANPLKSLRTE